jgi:hypothetical protein
MRFQDTNIKRALKNLFLKRETDLILLEPQMGLGDSLINMGLIKTISKRYPGKKFLYASLPQNFHSVNWMFHDLSNLYPVVAHSGKEARQLSGFYRARHTFIGGPNLNPLSFDRFYYEQHQIPFEFRWQLANSPPGPSAKILYERLNPNNEPYILVNRHQSGNKSYDLKIEVADSSQKIIEVHPATSNIFDWHHLALNAKEIHTIDTAFIHYIESLFYFNPAPTLYYHLARPTLTDFTRYQKWNIVDYGLNNPKASL